MRYEAQLLCINFHIARLATGSRDKERTTGGRFSECLNEILDLCGKFLLKKKKKLHKNI